MTAPHHFEAYTTRLTIEGELQDPPGFTATLLANLAHRCHDEGATLIGHIKCHCRTAAGNYHCSLTSLRSGARCSVLAASATPVNRVDTDLAVLVYGLELDTLRTLTEATVDALCLAAGVRWAIEQAPSHDGH